MPDMKTKFTEAISTNDAFKLLSIIGFLFIVLELSIIATYSASNGYEFSIYKSYPQYFWYALLISFFIGQVIILADIIIPSNKNNYRYGIIILTFSNIILLLIPYFRNYLTFGRFDVLTHIGYMVDIQNNASIGSNYYPMIHILGSIISSIADIELFQISIIIPVFFSLFFTISIYCFGQQIFENKSQVLLLLMIAFIPFHKNINSFFYPNGEAYLFLPFIIYIYFKQNDQKNIPAYKLLTILTGIFLIFAHPLVSILLISCLISLKLSIKIYRAVNKSYTQYIDPSQLILILSIVFLSWASLLYVLVRKINILLSYLFPSTGTPATSEFARYSDSLKSIDVDYLEIIRIYFDLYGQFFIFGVCSLLGIFVIYSYMVNKKEELKYYHVFSSIGFCSIFLISIFILVFMDDFGFMRFYIFTTIFSIILFVVLLNHIYKTIKIEKKNNIYYVALPIICIVLLFITYFSMFNLYFSPENKEINQQFTENEFKCMTNFYSVQNESRMIVQCGLETSRVHSAIFGTHNKYEYIEKPIKNHLGYENRRDSIKNHYKDSYLIITSAGKYGSMQIFPTLKSKWRFAPEDFNHLNNDTNAHRIFVDKDIEIYIIE